MTDDRLSNTFFALADATRRDILARLSRADATVGELAAPYAMSLAAVSKHLKVLERAGLVSRGRDAQFRPCHLEAKPLEAVASWALGYEHLWKRNLDSLAHYLKDMQRAATASKKRRTKWAPKSRSRSTNRRS
jgi:DNA-binding transcriptional ArsR family regulator